MYNRGYSQENVFISKLVTAVLSFTIKVSTRKTKRFPVMQIDHDNIAKLIDKYIRNRLFGQAFDPLENNNWRILLLSALALLSTFTDL